MISSSLPPTFEEHLQRLEQVLSRQQKYGLRVKPQKCHLLCTKIEYLGKVVSAEGVRPSQDKIAAVQKWPTPKTVKDVHAFLGLTGHFRRFVEDFTRLANPFQVMLREVSSCTKSKNIRWGKRQEEAFLALKKALTEAPMLAYADFTQPFI
ncbi:uncharacterized protein [Ranitomeya imitator]|uniref:uncharacterized protein n=1 Tax=Ranitomeya imitator TaxID=111125 RepID=UPI0037E739C2